MISLMFGICCWIITAVICIGIGIIIGILGFIKNHFVFSAVLVGIIALYVCFIHPVFPLPIATDIMNMLGV